MSGDVTIDNTGATAIGSAKVTSAMLAGSIADSKFNQLTSTGKVADSALSTNVDLANASQIISGIKTFTSTVTVTGNAFFSGRFPHWL